MIGNNGMTKFLLHGGYERRDNESNKAFYKELVQDVPSNGTVLLVYFASESDDLSEDFREQTNKIKEYSSREDIKFALATQENFLNELTQADAIHFRGGDTNKLLLVLSKYSIPKSLIENKTDRIWILCGSIRTRSIWSCAFGEYGKRRFRICTY